MAGLDPYLTLLMFCADAVLGSLEFSLHYARFRLGTIE